MEALKIVIGTAYVLENPMIPNSWHVLGQKDSPNHPYVMGNKNDAIRLCKTIDHYNKTDERKKFSLSEARKSIESESMVKI